MTELTRAATMAIPKNRIQLIKALEALKNFDPALWLIFTNGIREALEPEKAYVVRCSPALLPCAQGRAQLADDILTLVEHCGQYAEHLRAQELARQALPSANPT